MPQPEKVLARIQSLDERLARLRTEKNRLIARAGHEERKLDTRRKILAGAILLAKVEAGDFDSRTFRRWLEKALVREDDRKLFGL